MNYVKEHVFGKRGSLSFFDRFVQKQLFKKLSDLPHGMLIIEFDNQQAIFGSKSDENQHVAKIVVKDPSVFREFAFGGSMGAGESYMQGKWTSPDLVALVRLMSVNLDYLNDMESSGLSLKRFLNKIFHLFNRNTQNGSKQNISRHYDLGNDFFKLFLDPQMMYSSAVYTEEHDSLDAAAEYKLQVICEKLELGPDDHLLEIGTGWGGMALYAARNYRCRVTTTTISKEQYKAACARVKECGLEDRVTVLCEDYRNLTGRFDKLVSIEMIEAVGHQYYRQYFAGCSSLLKPGGLMLLQAITIPGQRFDYARKSVDFIQRYIFPGGLLPSHEVILTSVRKYTDLQMINMQEIGLDYARTLQHWREQFLAKLDEVRAQGFDDVFIRMWEFYLCYCQGAFEQRVIGTSHIVFEKPSASLHPSLLKAD